VDLLAVRGYLLLVPATSSDTSADRLDQILDGATAASGPFDRLSSRERGSMLVALADALEASAAVLVPVAALETHLPDARLEGELLRTTYQLRLFADVLADGSYLDATIDTADPQMAPVPQPDLRRILGPIGPVLVFAASNFPFAFSVAGGDTASALAAGCPVVLKAHPGHPRLLALTGEVVAEALAAAGAPMGAFAVMTGVDNGRIALLDPRIRAAAFTGSLSAGRALFDLAMSRETPIPFYGELGSLNPVFVTPDAAERRAAEIADGYVNSFTLGVGQFCTKPGLLFVPAGSSVLERLAELVRAAPNGEMLNDRLRDAYLSALSDLSALPGVRTVVNASGEDGSVGATLLAATVPALLADPHAMLSECFGPAAIVIEYEDVEQVLAAADAFEGSLTATVHGEPDENELVDGLLTRMRDRVGRIIWNGWPTGVAVTWAMHHGGPYPATTAPLHTSVGATAIRRFLRPVTYQSLPQELLPTALRDRNDLGIPRRVNGHITTADVPAET
jgi:NADP-dependent aldehyde dehydrogenase